MVVESQSMSGVVKGTALCVEVGRLLEEVHESLGSSGYPGLSKHLVVKDHREHLEHVTRGSKGGEDIG
jgi:hypothetical protein